MLALRRRRQSRAKKSLLRHSKLPRNFVSVL